MVTRDVNVRLNIEDRIKERLCFKKPTAAQAKRLSIPAHPFVEPISQLKEFQEFNKTESIHKRARDKLIELENHTNEKDGKIRRIISFDKERLEERRVFQRAESSLLTEDVSPELGSDKEIEYHQRKSPLRSHRCKQNLGTCAISEFLDEAESYEGETDILKIINILRKNKRFKFFYLTSSLPKRSTKYHFYNLKVVNFQNINRDDYYTLSRHGCTHLVVNDDIEHITLEQFETEYKTFNEICKIPTFARFSLWRGFIRWRKIIRYSKMEYSKQYLRDNLFIMNSSLRPALLNIREMCYRINDMDLCKLERDKTYTLLEFLTNQVNQLNEVCTRLSEFRELVKEVVRGACRTALLEYGFLPDDYLTDNQETEPLVVGTSYVSSTCDPEVYSDAPEKMTFTEMATKRQYCQRLTCFIRLADYQIVSTLHVLTVNSVVTILDCFSEYLRHTPTLNEIESYKIVMEELLEAPHDDLNIGLTSPSKLKESMVKSIKQEITDDKFDEELKLSSLFILEIILEPSHLYLVPEESLFQDGIMEIINKFQEQVYNIKTLTPDPYFDAFTRPLINNKFEDRICGIGPELKNMFTEDIVLQDIIIRIKNSLNSSFEAVNAYMNTFEEIYNFYKDNDQITIETIQKDYSARTSEMNHVERLNETLHFFKENLLKYHRQVKISELVPVQKSIGMFLVDTSTLRTRLLPSPNKCLGILHNLLPVYTRGEIDRLVQETQEAEYTLSITPSSTVDYVNYFAFLNKMQIRIEPIEKEAEFIKELYEMIEAFNVPVPPEDYAMYQSLLPSIDRAKNAIDKALSDRDVYADKFFSSLEKDITELMLDIKEAKQAINNPILLDATAEREAIRSELSRLQTIMDDLQNRAITYKAYHRKFKDLAQALTGTSIEDQILARGGVKASPFVVESPRFEELEAIVNEMKLKHLLWDSLDEWNETIQQWMKCEFFKLNPEDLTNITMKYVKSVALMEKGLPPNTVVPLLKNKVEDMRVKLTTIMDLRNPSLKPRHWKMLEELVGFQMSDLETPLSLGVLNELKAFNKAEQIQEISGQASSESSLEMLLKKVEDSWKSTEFVVLPYKDSKDVFIVGGTDEIQQLWDDSNINISTIASSRHVGPIKSRIDEWQILLELFGKTLDEWMQCQRSWLYLESIFSAPDIQRQLPSEAKSFMAVDKSYKDVMRKVQKVPLAMRAATQPGLFDTFRNNNQLLDQIQKCLEAYLESKRQVFPRFYFLSNDELLEILAQTRNPLAVQPHLRKCFDAIVKLEFGLTSDSANKEEPVFTNDILAMVSPEGERVSLGKGLKARGNVEDWLGKVEEAMFVNLRKLMKIAINDYESLRREEWLKAHANQIILTVEQLMWSRDITLILEDPLSHDRLDGLKEYEEKCFTGLNKLAALVRSELPKLFRALLCALITIDVHSRDMVTELVNNKVDSLDNFNWQRQLRYYWDMDLDTCVVKMANACYVYGYEYLGASPRLVITPLTDRCYLCLMGALQLDLGGAPAGPAGTGKTETTKDLAKSVAKQCVVFNCSDGLDYKMMGRFFSGLAQSGAWCCFDEFNRIDIEVLSVIAQQLITIRNAKAARVTRFMFEGREIKLVPTCAAFITMNPGYAGRTELPDNLKSLFRPISMMVPDYRLIAEVILYSEGFESSKTLALKMTQMYKLCSEQLSQQDHYDFGMRALKSVLVMAGSLKRENPDKPEDVVLIRALRDSNLPKFLKQDAILFTAILQDLFPGVTLPEHNYGRFLEEIETVLQDMNLQIISGQVLKVIQFYETLLVRHGVMLVGPTGGGKTTVYRVLAKVLGNLHAAELPDGRPDYQPVKTYVLNPKSITMGELYGEVNKLTLEWHDGLLASIVRQTCVDSTQDHQWVICDGPVDALWIENMNTVLDDNKMLCLANSERIKLTNYVHMLFEVQDLAVASPATVSRCGMVYVDPEELGWLPYVKTWIKTIEDKLTLYVVEYLMNLFMKYVEPFMNFVMTKCTTIIPQVPIARVQTMCKLLEVLLTHPGCPSMNEDKNKLNPLLAMSFVFSLLWGLAGSLINANWDACDTFIRNLFDDLGDARLPQHSDLWSCYVDMETRRMDNWEKMLNTFIYNKQIPFFDMIVPTVDTVRYGYMLDKLLAANQSVLFTGLTGVGKSVVVRGTLNNIAELRNYIPAYLNFSAQTSSNRTQEIIENKLEKKKKYVLGAPKDKRIILFVDDLNMPKQDTYGSQPPIELLRQYQDFHGFYDRDKLEWIKIKDMILCAACGPPGGGRNPITPRLIRHFGLFAIPPPSEISLKQIFSSIINGYLLEFPQGVRTAGESIVNAAVEIYTRMAKELLPTPTKSHYVFNLRDLSKCIQGVLQGDPIVIRNKQSISRLFYHEAQRVFHDRLINQEDKKFFNQILSEMALKYFSETIESETFTKSPILFGDFSKPGLPRSERLYEELTDMDKLKSLLMDYLDDYNMTMSKDVKLVFFVDAIEHVCRIARMIRQDRGNALLVGVGGTGKQSLTRLAAHINDYQCFQIELCRGYDYSTFHDDLKRLYYTTGVENKSTVFLFTDNQIVIEEFLEDINNMLNSGEVPNLFESDEYERLIIGCRSSAKDVGIAEGNRDGIYEFCINRVRNNLHIVLCMSPVGSNFRVRCRMFPSLVNCCTIDWFVEWPEEALYSVAKFTFAEADFGTDELKESISKLSTGIHLSVSEAAERFYNELKRHYYTTPTSYLELLGLYMTMLNKQIKELTDGRDKFRNGLNKILETNDLIAKMETELTAMRPILEAKQRDTEKLMIKLSEDQEQADIVRNRVKEDEALAKQKAAENQVIADDAQRDLDEAIPALEAANKALDSLDKNDISEIRVFTKPPQLVQTVMEAVCIMLGQKGDWATAKTVLNDSNFLRKLVEYPKDDITDAQLRKLKKFIDNPEFIPETVEKTSKACKSMCMWVRALDLYAHIFRTVEPKRKRLEEANADLDVVMRKLQQKQAELATVEQKIASLQQEYDQSVGEKKKLEHRLALTSARLKRAGKLTTALADEQDRWKLSIDEYNVQLNNVVGDVFVAAACVAYYGAFTADYREYLIKQWVEQCRQLKIPVSEDLTLFSVLGDAFEVRQWNTQGLPRDQVSTDNAILATRSRRWPLMIDPQEQANRWIRSMESQNNLKIAKLSDSNLLRILENCIRVGCPLLLEDIGETLDPALEPILLKQIFMSGGRLLIRLGDSDIEYDKNFRFYLTSKLANPHYLPEVSIKVTIINFTVTPNGLEDQLLGDVTGIERPELEEQRSQLIVRINTDKNQLKETENRILKLLFESEGNILDNEDLINTLNESKIKSSEITKRLTEATITEQKITLARSKYLPIASRGSVMYFVITTLADIDPMYQFSLKYFKNLFNSTIQNSPKASTLDERIQILLNSTTKATYNNVARGLFQHDKLVFSFILCIEILKQMKQITFNEWIYFLLGSSNNNNNNNDYKQSIQPNDTYNWLNKRQWKRIIDLAYHFPDQFKTLPNDICNYYIIIDFNQSITDSQMEQYRQQHQQQQQHNELQSDLEESGIYILSPKHYSTYPLMNYNEKLTLFQKLLLISIIYEEKIIQAITNFIRISLGKEFIETPSCSLSILYKEMNCSTPLIFILSTGSDPMNQFQKFAKEFNYLERVHAVSLGQGQGPTAEKLIDEASKIGDWVFLQNCHLAASWMIRLEELVKQRAENPKSTHTDFRLYLSSMPSKSFPIYVLQNSVKVTNEPPKGLRANLSRAINDISAESFETHVLGGEWRKLVFGICFFHSIVLERKKFGPLGWNISYDFNDSDRECALLNLEMFCHESYIPWDALTYITAEITYGGRVTDFWDQRCLRTILQRFFHPSILQPNYVYSSSGIYYPPDKETLAEYLEYVSSLPFSSGPELFGMNENANLVYQNSLKQLKKAIKGFVVMSEDLEGVYTAFLQNSVPTIWSSKAYPSLKPLGSWVKDLVLRCDFINTWMIRGKPLSFWISGFFFPQGFLTGILQNYARKYDYPIDHLTFNFNVLPYYRNQEEISVATSKLRLGETLEADKTIEKPKDGVLVHGLFMDGFRWDDKTMQVTDSILGEMLSIMPILHMKPEMDYTPDPNDYIAPLYKTAARAGVLSTTGMSTNFIVAVPLKTSKPQAYWIEMGASLLCECVNP
ncbi:Dynein heavy chain 6, axonemal [Schistosoma japonicum]|nr:Dynein heavy chain 6, axonemal [Schistosoma japonicum]